MNFVSFCLSGDRFDPEQATRLLKVEPTLAYRKNEPYKTTRTGRKILGRTNVWIFSTETDAEASLADHANHLRETFGSQEAAETVRLLEQRYDCTAELKVVWVGSDEAAKPTVPPSIYELADRLNAEVIPDFEVIQALFPSYRVAP